MNPITLLLQDHVYIGPCVFFYTSYEFMYALDHVFCLVQIMSSCMHWSMDFLKLSA